MVPGLLDADGVVARGDVRLELRRRVPSYNRFVGVVFRLAQHIPTNFVPHEWADSFLPREMCAPAFHSLDQSGYDCDGHDAQQDVHVRGDHAKRQQVGAFLSGDGLEVAGTHVC